MRKHNMQTIGIDNLRDSEWINYHDDELIIIEDITKIPRKDSFQPFKLNFTFMFFCTQGLMMIELNGDTIMVHPHEVLISGPESVIGNHLSSPDLRGGFIAFPPSKIEKYIFLGKRIWGNLKYLLENPVIKLTEEEIEMIAHYYSIAKYNMNHTDHFFYRHEMSASLMQCFMFQLINITERLLPRSEEPDDTPHSSNHLFKKFIYMVNEGGGRVRSVASCAEKLNVSPKYLSVVVKRISGQTALHWIHEATKKEIEKQIRYSDCSIKEICNNLGFPSISFFGKFFKAHFGMSPSEYRRRICNP